jgi:hypothetical protein
MEHTEVNKIKELIRYLFKWTHDNYSYKNTTLFNKVLRIINLQTSTIHELTKDDATTLTVEEKLQNAVFYVDEFGSIYKINLNMQEERWFDVSNVEEDNDTFIVHYDNIPAASYFLGAIRL